MTQKTFNYFLITEFANISTCLNDNFDCKSV